MCATRPVRLILFYFNAVIASDEEYIYSKYNSQCPSRLTARVRRSCDAEGLKLSSDGGDSHRKKCKQDHGGAYGGFWRNLCLEEVWSLESGGRFCVDACSSNVASVAVKMFSYLIYFKEILSMRSEKIMLR
jgi:hypothetical protein